MSQIKVEIEIYMEWKNYRAVGVAEPPKCLGPPAPVIVPKTSGGDVGDPPTLEVG